jgi:hypothetical protein
MVHAITLLSIRAGRWHGEQGVEEFIRPEVGLQLIGVNLVVTPKFTLLYGRGIRIGGASAEGIVPQAAGVVTLQLGVSVNLGTLAYRRQRGSEVAPVSE